MPYTTDILKERGTLIMPESVDDGKGQRVKYREGITIWCGLQFTRGARSIRAGELDAYEQALFRSRYISAIDDGVRLFYKGKYYNLTAIQKDQRDNTVQAVAIQIKPFAYEKQ